MPEEEEEIRPENAGSESGTEYVEKFQKKKKKKKK
jgi:hypothetical protein